MNKIEFKNLKKERMQLLSILDSINRSVLQDESYTLHYGLVPEVWEDGYIGKILFGLLVVKDKLLEEIKQGLNAKNNLEKISLINKGKKAIVKMSAQIDTFKCIDIENRKRENKKLLDFIIDVNLINYTNNAKDNSNYASISIANWCLNLLNTDRKVQKFESQIKNYNARKKIEKYLQREINVYNNYTLNEYAAFNKYKEMEDLNNRKLGFEKTYELLGYPVPKEPNVSDVTVIQEEIDNLISELFKIYPQQNR